MLIIPAIDVKAGRVVRLFQGKFDAVTDYSGDGVTIAKRYAAFGAPLLHVVDLDGAAEGTPGNMAMIRAIIDATEMDVQVGGGVRTQHDALRLFEAGVTRVVVGSIAITEPAVVADWLIEFGPERIVLALDINLDDDGTPRVTTHGWTQQTDRRLGEVITSYGTAGLRHVLCTDVSRDGAMTGPNTELYKRIASDHPSIALQASGGVRGANDLAALAQSGAHAAIVGKALLDGHLQPKELTPYLPAV
ncbi:MAG: 1-(5-phosphoribosyl)-5-[(5-phosphoribosylamino)methylideneamino]imidazole-4-carboxamide isomerase [Pseudomonadota bacterium]